MAPMDSPPAPLASPTESTFGLQWPGKAAAAAAAHTPARTAPLPANAFAAGHTLLAGDNLDALKLLLPTHRSTVRMVYIDPPYNGGTDHLYGDTFRGPAGRGGNHAAWLGMMLPRLLLARDLLRDDGVLFVSIGDEELAHLRLLCDEVFGERNFVGCVPRITKRTSNKGTHFAPSKDYVLVFARNLTALGPFHAPPDADYARRFRGEDARGRFATVALFQNALDPRPNQRYWVQCPDGSFAIPPGPTLPAEVADGAHVAPQGPADRVWRWSHASYRERRDLLVWKRTTRSPLRTPDGGRSPWNVYTKYYLEDRLRQGLRPRDFLDGLTNDQGTAELRALGLDDWFPFCKPVGLVRRLLQWIDDREALVLDFFAGSGTTGHAVLAQNAADGGSRRCVLVQNLEPTGRADFPSIADLTQERLRRAKARLDAEQPPRPGERREFQRFDLLPTGAEPAAPLHSPPASGTLVE